MDSLNIAALEADAPLYAWFVEVVGAVTLRLFTGGAADIAFSSLTFSAESSTYGTIGGIDSLTNGIDAESPRPTVEVLCPTDAAAAALMMALAEDTTVRIWLGLLSRETGQPVATPELFFDGYVDLPNVSLSHGMSTVTLDCVTFAERFHDAGEGMKMNTSSHIEIRPGELAFDFVNKTEPVYWGGATPGATGDKGSINTTVGANGVLNGGLGFGRRGLYA